MGVKDSLDELRAKEKLNIDELVACHARTMEAVVEAKLLARTLRGEAHMLEQRLKQNDTQAYIMAVRTRELKLLESKKK